MKCNKCSTEMEFFEEGPTCGWKCNSCGITIVTTNDDGIDMDETLYTLYILPDNSASAPNIKCVAKIFECSFLDAKKILIAGKDIEGLKAMQSRDIIRILKSTDILYSVTPDFDYKI